MLCPSERDVILRMVRRERDGGLEFFDRGAARLDVIEFEFRQRRAMEDARPVRG